MLTLYILLAICTTYSNADGTMIPELSLVKPYFDAKITLPNWDFIGSTLVTSNYIRLTPDYSFRSGAIWSSLQCKFQNWRLNISFKVFGKDDEYFGDGLAIWYAKDRLVPGPVFGSKDYFHGLAVILHTHTKHNGLHDHKFPFISAIINNGTLSYVHDGSLMHIADCAANFRNTKHDAQISIEYLNSKLTVSTNVENEHEWKECFELENVKLPTGYYFGATASTGDLSDNHDIISFNFHELHLRSDNATLAER